VDKPLIVLSLGFGVQSFTLAAMSALGELPKVDAAIHANTLHEFSGTYDFARQWTLWLEEHGIRVITVPPDDGGRLLRCPGVAVAAYSRKQDKDGILPRQCTSHWKVAPLRRKARELLGPTWRTTGVAEMWIGISLDEIQRMRQADVRYLVHRWPLVERRMTRGDCKTWLTAHGLPVPPKSACVFCPFRSNAEWRDVAQSPDDWLLATLADKAIRDALLPGQLFLHSSRQPLEQVDFRSEVEKSGQLSLWQDECEGMCGI